MAGINPHEISIPLYSWHCTDMGIVTVKKSTTFQNTPNDMFPGVVFLQTAIVLWSISFMLFSMRYPGDLISALILVCSILLGYISYKYLAIGRASLKITGRGVTYVPRRGKPIYYPWRRIGCIRASIGWVWLHDKSGRKLISFSYGICKRRLLLKLFSIYGNKHPKVVSPLGAWSKGRLQGPEIAAYFVRTRRRGWAWALARLIQLPRIV